MMPVGLPMDATSFLSTTKTYMLPDRMAPKFVNSRPLADSPLCLDFRPMEGDCASLSLPLARARKRGMSWRSGATGADFSTCLLKDVVERGPRMGSTIFIRRANGCLSVTPIFGFSRSDVRFLAESNLELQRN